MAKVTAELTDSYTVRISNGRHTWAADEPPAGGGDDAGPTPYEMLLGALAACTCITVRMYCQRKGWRLDAVSAEFTHDRVHADDCANCEEDATGYLDHVRSQVFIDGDFDDTQRERLAEVVERCPVHKTLVLGMNFVGEEVHIG